MRLNLRHRVLQRLGPVLIGTVAVALRIAAVIHDGWMLLVRAARACGRKFKAAYTRLTLQLAKLRVHYFVEVSSKAKCPACGIREKHQIIWSDIYQAVMHECARCKAHWGERPIATLEAWKVQPIPLPDEQRIDPQPKTTTKIRQVS